MQNPNKIVQAIPEQLPLLEEFIQQFGRIDLTNACILAVQHLQASTVALFATFNRLGISFKNIFVCGKSYSTNPQVVLRLRQLGINVNDDSERFSGYILSEDYRNKLKQNIQFFIHQFQIFSKENTNIKKLIVLDDGGVLISSIDNYMFKENSCLTSVEQTRSGIRKILFTQKHKNINFPIINVAESNAKLTYESPYIARAVVDAIKRSLKNLPFNLNILGTNTLVVGYGSIGCEVSKILRNEGALITVYDVCKDRTNKATQDGFLTQHLNQAMYNSKIIVGCVGEPWLTFESSQFIRNSSILVSTSSSNIDFLNIPRKSTSVVSTNFEDYSNNSMFKIHANYLINMDKSRHCYILNGGFPVNFDGSLEDIPLSIVQFTQALMLAGAYQAIEEKRSGVTKLHDKFQSFLIRKINPSCA